MKIFAKRKKKSTTAPVPPGERKTFASDPIVEELLKKDPGEWNSKEKRMVARYQKRKEKEGVKTEENNDAGKAETNKEDADSGVSGQEPKQDAEEEEKEENSSASDGENDNDESDDSSDGGDSEEDDDDDDDTSKSAADDENAKELSKGEKSTDADEPKPMKTGEDAEKKEENATKEEEEEVKKDSDAADGKVDPNDEVFKLFDQLNSKQKRTLSRKLDREGASVLEEVRAEAKKILGLTDDSSSKKRGQDDDGGSKKKKRKKGVDWSTLPPEERLRREEQRKKQKEAAERRERGEDKHPGYKHPLNSERRRANRRKPKWKAAGSKGTPNEHHSSGYLHRKNRKEEF